MRLMAGIVQNQYVKATWITLLSLYIAYYLGTAIVMEPYRLRTLLAVGLALIFYATSLVKPGKAMIGLFFLLPLLGLIRRALIPLAGWSVFDPFVILVPALICFLGANYYYGKLILKQPELDDSKLFKLVRWFLFVHIVEVFNPIQGGLFAGMAGVMFYVTPLMWMTLTRIHFSEKLMKGLLKSIPIVATFLGLYGLKQIYIGYAPFEKLWITLSDTNSLNISDTVRSISTFTSAGEYGQFLVIATMICWAFMLKEKPKRLLMILQMPLLFFSLFMTSQRGPVISGFVALTIMTIISAKKGRPRAIAAILTIIGVVGAYIAIINIEPASNGLVAHQVNGLANPFDEQDSTLGLHWTLFSNGLLSGLTHPLGHGLGASTLAGSRLGAGAMGSEIDITNIMISDGIVGFILFLLIIVNALKSAFRLYKLEQSAMSLALIGVLISTLGYWCIGGNYSTTAFVWICIGFMDRMYVKKSRIYQEQAMNA